MKKRKHLRLLATIVAVLMLLSALSGCQTGKKFDLPESMISEMIGTYSGSDEHSGERIVIDGNNIIKFNLDDIFPEITDDNFFWENFPNENWETFDINALLGKTYIDITTESISANIKDSTISGLWVNKDGVLYSSVDGYPLNKISSDCIYPTAEMQEKFEGYLQYLKEYEISAIIAESESNLSEKQNSLESALSSAASSSTSKKSTATAKTIAECAFESIKDYLKYPRTAELDSYSTSPQYDPYGRVTTLIAVTAQNGFGNYITEDYYVVLQSCSSAGYYTHKTGGMHYTTEENHLSFLLTLNDWNEDPNADSAKEPSYNEAIQLIEDKKYQLATSKLSALGDYKSSAKLKEACINLSIAEEYKKAIDLFAEGKYTEASKELTALLKDNDDGYLRAERIITLCAAASSNTSSNGDAADSGSNSGSGNISQPPATQPPATQPPATQPPATQPPATQPPTVCSHNYADATCTTPKTCTLCGQTSGSALGHTYSAATCTAPKTCNSCGATTGSAAGHTWKNATCTEPATCTTCQETWGSANGHSWREATCTAPKTCQSCKTTEGSALPHNMYGTRCFNCDYTDFSEYTLTSNTFCSDSWFKLDGARSQDLEDGEASISIDSKGVCKVSFDKYSYTFTLKQTDFGSEPVFECYLNGEPVKTARVTFYYSQNRCDFFLYGGALGFSQVALDFDM